MNDLMLILLYVLIRLQIDPDDRSDMFLRNFCWHLPDYTALYPRRQNSS
jgi:hypothetical protein